MLEKSVISFRSHDLKSMMISLGKRWVCFKARVFPSSVFSIATSWQHVTGQRCVESHFGVTGVCYVIVLCVTCVLWAPLPLYRNAQSVDELRASPVSENLERAYQCLYNLIQMDYLTCTDALLMY